MEFGTRNLENGINILYFSIVLQLRNEYMKLRQEILDKIDNPQTRTAIASELLCGEQNIAVHLRRNADNGRMTKMDALQAISKVAGISVGEILEESIEEGTTEGK